MINRSCIKEKVVKEYEIGVAGTLFREFVRRCQLRQQPLTSPHTTVRGSPTPVRRDLKAASGVLISGCRLEDCRSLSLQSTGIQCSKPCFWRFEMVPCLQSNFLPSSPYRHQSSTRRLDLDDEPYLHVIGFCRNVQVVVHHCEGIIFTPGYLHPNMNVGREGLEPMSAL